MNADFWLRIALAVPLILGVWTLFGKGMLLERLGDRLERTEPAWLNKPLWICPPCMSSVWGTAIWFATGGDWIWWPAFVLALCGVLKLCVHNLLR